jgi:hypothetical protein
MFDDPYFDRVWQKMSTGDATPSEQQDMALRIETILIQLQQARDNPPRLVFVPPLGHPYREGQDEC